MLKRCDPPRGLKIKSLLITLKSALSGLIITDVEEIVIKLMLDVIGIYAHACNMAKYNFQ